MPNSAEPYLRARDFIDDYDKPLRIRDGSHKLEIIKCLVDFATLERAEARRETIEECAKVADELCDAAKADMQEFRAIGLSIAAYSEEEMKAHRKCADALRAKLTPAPEAKKGKK